MKLRVLPLVRARLPSCRSGVSLRAARSVIGGGLGLVGGHSGGAGWFGAVRPVRWLSGKLE